MIRINLLGVPKKTTRGGRRASTVAATGGGGEGSSTVILGLIFAGALVVLIGLAHMWVQREHDVLEKNLQKAQHGEPASGGRESEIRGEQEKGRHV